MTYMLCVRSQNLRRLSPQSNQVRVTLRPGDASSARKPFSTSAPHPQAPHSPVEFWELLQVQ